MWAVGHSTVRHQTSVHPVWRYSHNTWYMHTTICKYRYCGCWNVKVVPKTAVKDVDNIDGSSKCLCVFVLTGKRPFGVSLLYMGWDKHYGFQLYQSDPSGNYGGWKATCIGNNSAVSAHCHCTEKKCGIHYIALNTHYVKLHWNVCSESAVPESATRRHSCTGVQDALDTHNNSLAVAYLMLTPGAANCITVNSQYLRDSQHVQTLSIVGNSLIKAYMDTFVQEASQ